jgi:hypothetical protein
MIIDCIPEELQTRCKDYFNGSDMWFFICHPALDYLSPWRWISEGKDLQAIENLLNEETKDNG